MLNLEDFFTSACSLMLWNEGLSATPPWPRGDRAAKEFGVSEEGMAKIVNRYYTL